MIQFYTIINLIFLFIYWLLIVGVTLRIMTKRRTVPSAMAWLLIIYTLPIVGIVTYILLGELNLGTYRTERSKIVWAAAIKQIENKKHFNTIIDNENSEVAKSLFQLCERRQGIGAFDSNQMQILTNSDVAIQSLLHDIYLAKNKIDIVFYIWQTGGLVDQVAEALIAAAQRGVRCRLMLDSAGSIEFFRSSYPNLMRSAGVHIVEALHVNLFRAVLLLRRMDLRQHRKMVLIDNYIAYTGSMNMVDPRFFKQNAGVGQWIDIMVRIEGPATIAMEIIFSYDWEIETGEHVLPLSEINIIPFETIAKHTVQVIASGPGFPEGMIHQALLISIYAARKKLVITTPYLVPSDDLLRAICTAAQCGVDVHIIVPRYNDSMLVGWASRSFFSELLEAGVIIHQFEKGLLHTKSLLIDDKLSLVGTVNLDMRSLWLNLEITLVIDDDNFSNKLRLLHQDYISHSKLIELKTWLKRPYWHRILERFFYFFSPLL